MRENRKQLLSRALIMIAILCAFSLITGLGESSTYNRYENLLSEHHNITVDDAKNSFYESYEYGKNDICEKSGEIFLELCGGSL